MDLVFTSPRGGPLRNHNVRRRAFAPAAEVYAGLFGDDLDAVADRLDDAAARARADSLRTPAPQDEVLPLAAGAKMAARGRR